MPEMAALHVLYPYIVNACEKTMLLTSFMGETSLARTIRTSYQPSCTQQVQYHL